MLKTYIFLKNYIFCILFIVFLKICAIIVSYKLKGAYKIMDKKTLKNYVKKGKLLAIVSPKTTFRKCYINWYVIKSNDLFYVGSTYSSVVGMNRSLDCYFKLLDKFPTSYNYSSLNIIYLIYQAYKTIKLLIKRGEIWKMYI